MALGFRQWVANNAKKNPYIAMIYVFDEFFFKIFNFVTESYLMIKCFVKVSSLFVVACKNISIIKQVIHH